MTLIEVKNNGRLIGRCDGRCYGATSANGGGVVNVYARG